MKMPRPFLSRVALLAFGLFVLVIGVAVPSPTDRAEAARPSIQTTWTDQAGRHIVLRTGTYKYFTGKGFGWTKINQRHHIRNLRVLRFAIKSDPGYRDGRSTTQRIYSAYAVRYVCSWGHCRATESVRYQVVVEFKGFHSYYGVRLNNATVGLMTAYCHMPNRGLRCPHWVDTAIGAAPIGSTNSPSSLESNEDDGSTNAGFSSNLRFPLPSVTNPDGTTSEQYVAITGERPASFVEPIDPIDSYDGNDPDYDGDPGGIVCGQCPPPDDGT